jgi:glutathione synthase/RimK-type ligase-like ATP-grasp enzyme
MNILITGVGGPTPRNFAKSLKLVERYKNAKLIATDIHPLAIGLYQNHLFDEAVITPKSSDENYWPFMLNLIKEKEIDYAVILPEREIQAWAAYAKTNELPCPTLIPETNLTEACVDKALMTEMLDELGLVPKSVSFSRSIFSYSEIAEMLGNEFWVRSATGTSGLGSLLIKSEKDLMSWVDINPGVSTFLASSFLPGRNYACKLLYFNGKLLRSACGERVNYIMAKVSPSGITGNTSFGRLLNRPDLQQKAEEALELLFAKTNAPKHGFFTVDFKEDADDNPFITEINVRHVAFTHCFAQAGANFAADTLDLLSGTPDFSTEYHTYQFEEGTIFLRDVDEQAIIMNEKDLI